MAGGAAFEVALEVKPVGAVRGTREMAGATKELTAATRESGQESRKATTAADELAAAERRRLTAAAEMVRAVKSQITVLAEYQKQLLSASSAEAARAITTSRMQAGAVAGTGVDPSSRLGTAMQALLERERQLRASVQETAAELARTDKVAGNIAGLQARTKAMEAKLVAAKQGEAAERAYAEALEVVRAIEASGAKPGTDQAASVEREVRAQQRLEAELRAVAAARERDRRVAAEAAAERDRVAGEITRLRETTHQLEVLATAHRKGGAAVQAANVSLEVRNALLRTGVSAGSADAVVIEQEVRAQARLRGEIDQATAAKRRATDGASVLRNAFFALQGAIAALGLSALIRDAVQVALAFDRAFKSLFAATGSQAGAAREMAFVTAEADRLGLVLTDTAQAYAGLAAASKGTTLEGQGARNIFSAVAEASTVMGLSAEQANGALLAIQQMMSKGTVQAEELRGQLGERLPGAFQIAARAMGTTTAGLGKMLEQGKVTAADMLPKLAAELRKTFGPGLTNAVNSAQANLNRFRNGLDQVKAALGEGFLSGFLAGFADLKQAMSGAELRQAARDVGQSIGKALRDAADGAAFLAKNLELVKAVLIAILALKVASWFGALATAIVEATGATVTFRLAASNLAGAAGLGLVGIVLLGLVVVMEKYIATSRLAMQTELARVDKSQELFGYYNTLKANKIGLTTAEWEYAKSVRATMEAEKAALVVSLARTRSQISTSRGMDPFSTYRRSGLMDTAKDQEREIKNVDNQLRILDSQWHRLANLPTIKLPPIDPPPGLDKTAKKIADLLDGFRRAAEQAERIAKANTGGAEEAQRVTDAIERENAAYGALHSIEGLSAASKAKLSAVIETLVGRSQAAAKATAELTSLRERDLVWTNAGREAEAKLADSKAGNTEASRQLAAALEAEGIALADRRGTDAAYIKTLTDAILVRNEYIRSIDMEVAADERGRQAKRDKAGLEAQLADAITNTANATRQHAIELEIEQRLIAAGVREWEPKGRQIREEIELRAAARDAILGQVAAAERLRAQQATESHARAEFSDWQAQEAAARKYGAELAGILGQFGLLNQATRELAIQEEILAAIRAEGVQIDYNRGKQWNLDAMNRQAAIAAEIRGHYAVLDSLAKVQAAHAVLAYALEPLRQAWDQVKSSIKSALIDMAMTGKVSFKELAQTLLRTMLDAIYEMVVRWIAAHHVMQAEAMKTAAVNAAATGVGGAGGGAGAVAAGGGQIGSGLTGLIGGGGGASTAGMGALAGMGAVLAIFAVIYLGVSAWIKTHAKIVASATASIEGGKVAVNQMSGNAKTIQGVIDGLRGAVQQAINFIKTLGATVTALDSEITLARKGQGKKTNWTVAIGGLVKTFGKDVEAALEYAAIQAARQSVYTGLDPITEAAIKRSVQEKWDAFQSDVELAQRVAMMGKPESAQAQAKVHQEVDFLIAEMVRILGPSEELTAALANINQYMVIQLQSQRDQLTGHQRTAAEQHTMDLAEAHAWNAELAMRKADLALKIIQAKANIALYESTKHAVGGGGHGTGAGGGGVLGFAGAMLYVAGAATAASSMLSGSGDETLDAMNAQLAALEQLQAALNNLKPIEDGEVGGKKGGKGTKGQDRDTLKGLLDDAAWAQRMRGLSDYLKGLAEINKKWDDARKLAHGNAKELEKVEAARRAEIAALREAERIKLGEELKPYLQDRGKSDFDLRLEALRKQFEEARQKAKELGEALWKVNLAEERAAHALGQQAIAALGLPTDQTIAQFTTLSDTLNFVRMNAVALGISEQELGRITAELGNQLYGSLVDSLLKYVSDEKVKKDLAQLRYQMEIANIQLQFKLAKEMGVLTMAQIATVQGLIDKLPELAPDAGAGAGGGSGNGGARDALRDKIAAREEAARVRMEEARSLLAKYAAEGGNDYTRQRLQIEADFVKIRAALGNTAPVILEYAKALGRLREQFLAGVKDFRDALKYGPQSGLTMQQQYEASVAKYQQTLAAVQGGDLSQADALRAAGERTVELLGQMFGTSTGGFAEMRAKILADLEAILGADAPAGSGSAAAGLTPADMDRSVSATNKVTDMVDYRGRRQEDALYKIASKLDNVVTAVNDLGAPAPLVIQYGGK